MNFYTADLKKAREDAGISQAALAADLGVSPSLVSRLERTATVDEAMAKRYLKALPADVAGEIGAFYSQPWTQSDRPSFYHPDRASLGEAERALQHLDRFVRSGDYDELLQRPVDEIRRGLATGIGYLTDLRHALAFVGPVGVGKTTALSLFTNLVVQDKLGHRKPAFPASGGRTTLSEVTVKTGAAFAIAVDPLDEQAVRHLLRDLVGGVARKQGGVSTELDRAIRNMANLKKSGDEEPIDPAAELLAKNGGDEALTVEDIAARMSLQDRRENQLIMSADADVADGLNWVADNFRKINYGQHPQFSLPSSVTVLVPAPAMRRSPFDLSIIDTKGILGNTTRGDLQRVVEEDRTIAIVCCRFNDAPGAETLRLLKTLQISGSDIFERQRATVLVLPRSDEALKVVDSDGEEVETVQKGYSIRRSQIRSSFVEDALPEIPIRFFNASTDDPKKMWDALSDQISQVRAAHVERLSRTVARAENLIADPDTSKILQARIGVRSEIGLISDKYINIKARIRPPYQHLIEELRYDHASSIAASVNRRGDWYNFSMDHMIGVGLRVDANLRTEESLTVMLGRLDGIAQRFEPVPEIPLLIGGVKEKIAEWRQEFLSRAQAVGRSLFKSQLDDADELWSSLYYMWGWAQDIARELQTNFVHGLNE